VTLDPDLSPDRDENDDEELPTSEAERNDDASGGDPEIVSPQ
jgi:hypothetical protein